MTRLENILKALDDAFGWKQPKAPEMMKIGPGTETVDGEHDAGWKRIG